MLIVVVLGLGGGIFVARRVLRRIDAMTGTTQRIMAGDLSGRLPVGRSGDELDRLAENLNAMLERIEALMMGLKEVSDNIAHDLKTPLTRLRNRAEEALAKSGSEAEYRAALERTIEESDGLIRTFNALLMIARAESGQARGNMDDFDAADVANGIHELYEPLAEDDGMTLQRQGRVGAAPRQPRIDQPGARQSGRERDQIRQAGSRCVQPLSAAVSLDAREILIEARREGDTVLLSVTDHGPGIPEADRKHAVERFVRLEASRTQPGSGLGLSLASAVATLHGGELRLGDAHPGLTATLAIPARGGRQRQACGSNTGCATEGGMTSSANGRRGPIIVWPRGSWTDRMCPPPTVPNSDWQTGSPIWRRSRRLRSMISALDFPVARTILLGIAEASPYLFDLMRADAARADPAARMRAGAASGRADRKRPAARCRPRPAKPR